MPPPAPTVCPWELSSGSIHESDVLVKRPLGGGGTRVESVDRWREEEDLLANEEDDEEAAVCELLRVVASFGPPWNGSRSVIVRGESTRGGASRWSDDIEAR